MNNKVFRKVFYLSLVLPILVSAQDNISELIRKYQSAENDSTKIVALLDMAFYYIYRNTDSTFYFCKEAYSIAERNNNRLEMANAMNIRAMAYSSAGDYAMAIAEVNQAIDMMKMLVDKNPSNPIYRDGLFKYYNTLGNAYYFISDFVSAVKYYLLSIKIAEENNSVSLPVLYGNIGSVYKELGEYEKSIDYHKRAMKLANETGNKSLYVNSVVNLGGVFYDYAKYDSAVYYYNLVLPEPNLSENPDVLITIYLNLSFINIALSEFDKARNYIAKAKEVIDKNDFTRSKIYYYNAIAELFAKEGDINKAITNTLAAYKLSDSLGEKTNMVNMLSNLCDMYAGINDYKNAYKYTLVKESVKDSVFNEKKAQIIKELEVKFLVEKKNLEIEKLKARQEADRRLRILLVSVLVFIISLSILLLYVLYEKRKRSEVEKELINTEKEKTVEKLHFQNRQLASQALTMMQKNKMLQELQKSISEIVKEKPENIGKQLNKIKFQIKRSINSEKDWEVFRLYFEQVNKTFFKNLKDINPELTDYDLRMAALIKLKLNIKESASLLNLSPNSVKGTRYRLRKKLGLSNSESLTDYIGNID